MSQRQKVPQLEQICANLMPQEIKRLDRKAGSNLMSRSNYIRKLVVEDLRD